jgi:hypothetical protein
MKALSGSEPQLILSQSLHPVDKKEETASTVKKMPGIKE